jgi:putative solute:sodium symporter small subunit
MASTNEEVHWRRTRTLMWVTLTLWLIFGFLVRMFVTPRNSIKIPFLDFPLGFYMAAQGSLIAFVLILFWFAWCQDRIGRDHHPRRHSGSSFIGAEDSNPISLWIWLAGTALLTLPAIGSFLNIGL